MTTRVELDSLIAFCVRVLVAAGISCQDAEITANALVAADLRGIDSHGVAHLGRYVGGLENGTITTQPNIKILNETPSTALLDGDRGLGFVVAHRSMELAIQKAKAAGSGLVVARRSTHYGAAGYWAAMALSHGLIGFSMTNAGPKVAPTFGSRAMLGTNPIGLAVPADQEPPFVLDMATSVVPAGRLEIYARKGQSLPDGWVIDSSGQPIHDPVTALTAVRGDEMSILPLGGEGESLSGYKGYGLSMGVEILSSMLAGYPGPGGRNAGRRIRSGAVVRRHIHRSLSSAGRIHRGLRPPATGIQTIVSVARRRARAGGRPERIRGHAGPFGERHPPASSSSRGIE